MTMKGLSPFKERRRLSYPLYPLPLTKGKGMFINLTPLVPSLCFPAQKNCPDFDYRASLAVK